MLRPMNNPWLIDEFRYRFLCNESISKDWGMRVFPVVSIYGGWFDAPVDGRNLRGHWISKIVGNPIPQEMKQFLDVDSFSYWESNKDTIQCVPSVLVWKKDTMKSCAAHIFTEAERDTVEAFLNICNSISLHDRSMSHLFYTDSMADDIDTVMAEMMTMTLEDSEGSRVVKIGGCNVELIA